MRRSVAESFAAAVGDLRATLLTAALLAAGAWAGCDLAGLAAPVPHRDTGPPHPTGDASKGSDGGEVVCEPGSVTCHAFGILKCSEDGTDFETESCADHEVCKGGQCRPLKNECETNLPFRLSKTELFFRSSGFLKSATADLTIENCSNFEIALSQPSRNVARFQPPNPAEVFQIQGASPFGGSALPPGASRTLTLDYAPKHGFFDGEATFQFNVQAEQTFPARVALHRQIDCVSTTPRLDIGRLEVGGTARVMLPLYNCGNRRQRVEIPDPGDIDSDHSILRWGEGAPESVELAPGESTTIPLKLTRLQRGELDVRIPFRSRRLASRIVGQVGAPPCFDARQIRPPRHRRTGASDWKPGQEIELSPRQTLRLEADLGEGKGRGFDLELQHAPSGSRARLEPRSEGQGETFFRFSPDLPGVYGLTAHLVSPDGRRSCQAVPLRLIVRPEAPLFVEVTWETLGDPIPDDVGFGRGVDLNAHLRAHREVEGAPQTGPWNDRRWGCFQYGDRAPSLCLTHEGESHGQVLSVSVDGVGAETIAVDEIDAESFDLAVRAFNTYDFPGARARIRIWADGRQLSETPLTQRIGRTDGIVWHVGTYDPDEQSLEITDEVRKSF